MRRSERAMRVVNEGGYPTVVARGYSVAGVGNDVLVCVPDIYMVTTEHALPEYVREPPARVETLTAAKRAVFEASNRILLVALAVVCAALAGVLFWTHGIYLASLDRSPLYFGIDSSGKIMQLRPESLSIELTDEIVRNQLEGFVEKHYSRIAAISAHDYKVSLLMMDSALTSSGTTVRNDRKQIEDLDAGPTSHEQIYATAVNSTYEGTKGGCDPKGQPCIATVYVTRRFVQGAQTVRESSAIIKVSFVILKKVKLDPDMVRYNPLGIAITGLYESEGHSQ